MVEITELSDSNQNPHEDSVSNITTDTEEDAGKKDTEEELKNLNNSPDLNKDNVIELMSKVIPLRWDKDHLHRRYVGYTACVDYLFPEGCTFLHIAARFDCDVLAKFLIEGGMDVNAPDKFGAKPLYYALKYNNFTTAKFLTDNGADRSCIRMISHEKAEDAFVATFTPIIVIGVFATLGMMGSIIPLNDISITEKILISCFSILVATGGAALIGGIAYGVRYTWEKHKFNSKLDKVKLEEVTLGDVPPRSL